MTFRRQCSWYVGGSVFPACVVTLLGEGFLYADSSVVLEVLSPGIKIPTAIAQLGEIISLYSSVRAIVLLFVFG